MILAHALPDGVSAFPLTIVLIVLAATHVAGSMVLSRRVDPGAQGGGAALKGAGGADPGTPRQPPGPASTVGRLLALLSLVAVVALAAFGSPVPSRNFTDVAVLSLLLGVVVVLSATAGPVWDRVQPLTGLVALIGGTGTRTPPARLRQLALTLSMVTWAWAQLLWRPGREGFLVALLLYCGVHVAAAGRYGTSWLGTTETLSAVSRTLGLVRPRHAASRLAQLGGQTTWPDSAAVVAPVLIGWGLTDLAVESSWWISLALTVDAAVVIGPVMLVASCAVTAVVLRLGLGRRFIVAAVPIAAGWAVAQYVPRVIVQARAVRVWLSDPFDTGADLLGAAGRLIDPNAVPALTVTVLQLVAFAAGHLLAAATIARIATASPLGRGSRSAATLLPHVVVLASLTGGAYLQLAGL